MSRIQHDNLNRMEIKEPLEGTQARFIHSENMTMAFWQFEQGADLPEHSHPHEQITHVLGGIFNIIIDGESLDLETGAVVVIPANAVHSGRAVTGCYVIDVFYPVREDFR